MSDQRQPVWLGKQQLIELLADPWLPLVRSEDAAAAEPAEARSNYAQTLG